MLRVLVCFALLVSACAFDPPPKPMTRMVVKERLVEINRSCPTDDQIRDAAVVASQDTYGKSPGVVGSCPCPDFKAKDGSRCGGRAARGWVYCVREDVPSSVVQAMNDKIQGCSKG
jgi:hypothetical protein